MFRISIQRVTRKTTTPTAMQLRRWAKHVLQSKTQSAELTIRIVSEKEMTALNHTYRYKNKPTNVLSFPFDMHSEDTLDIPLLGDIVICATVVNQESIDQETTAEAHWAHMIVHGTLHLLGYDHEHDADALIMEGEEIKLLQSLGYTNPYQDNRKVNHHD